MDRVRPAYDHEFYHLSIWRFNFTSLNFSASLLCYYYLHLLSLLCSPWKFFRRQWSWAVRRRKLISGFLARLKLASAAFALGTSHEHLRSVLSSSHWGHLCSSSLQRTSRCSWLPRWRMKEWEAPATHRVWYSSHAWSTICDGRTTRSMLIALP